MQIESLVFELSKDPFNPVLNFNVAVEYERLQQTASAVSFYLRTAEYGYTTHPLYVYSSLLRMAHCFEDQRGREHTVRNSIQQAISYLPTRREAYFLLANVNEKAGKWQETYTYASIGLSLLEQEPLPVDVKYYGEYCLEFEKAISAWWIGRKDESIEILKSLNSRIEQLRPEYRSSILNNLKNLGVKQTPDLDHATRCRDVFDDL